MLLDPDCAVEASQAALEAHLWELPGMATLEGLPRTWAGRQHQCSHLFSHIKLTLVVHRLVVQVRCSAALSIVVDLGGLRLSSCAQASAPQRRRLAPGASCETGGGQRYAGAGPQQQRGQVLDARLERLAVMMSSTPGSLRLGRVWWTPLGCMLCRRHRHSARHMGSALRQQLKTHRLAGSKLHAIWQGT